MSSLPVVKERAAGTPGAWRPRGLKGRGAHAGRAPSTPGVPGTQTAARDSETLGQGQVAGLLLLVRRMVWKARAGLPPHVEADDLVGAGLLGLVDALRKFDASKRVKMESYARHRIRGSILDGLRTLDPASRDMRKCQRRVEKVYDQLQGKLGRPVSDEEIALALGMSLQEWYRTLQELQAVGFDGRARQVSVGSSRIKPDCEEATVEDPFATCYRQEQRRLLDRALASLPERERTVVVLHDLHEETMKKIASRLNVDASRVSQLHAAALRRLKRRVQAMLNRPLPPQLAGASRSLPNG
jgi:RNA polymerase sigma factor for flagellar operon FliA